MNVDNDIINPGAAAALRQPRSRPYKIQARAYLVKYFRRISCRAIDVVLQEFDYDFTHAFNTLLTIQRLLEINTAVGDGNNEYRNEVVAIFPGMPRDVKVFIKNDRHIKKNISIADASLLQELANIPVLSETKENDLPVAAAKTEEDDDEVEVLGLLECGCCFMEYSPDCMVECTDRSGHFCCKECLERYVSEQLDGQGNTKFSCIIDSDCSQFYKLHVLDHVLPEELGRRVNERIFRDLVGQVEGSW